MASVEDDGFDSVGEALGRPPLRVDDSTTPESLELELQERLEALLASHNGMEPTLEGWRGLALALALRHEPAFQVETPVDRDSMGSPRGLDRIYCPLCSEDRIAQGCEEPARSGQGGGGKARSVFEADSEHNVRSAVAP